MDNILLLHLLLREEDNNNNKMKKKIINNNTVILYNIKGIIKDYFNFHYYLLYGVARASII